MWSSKSWGPWEKARSSGDRQIQCSLTYMSRQRFFHRLVLHISFWTFHALIVCFHLWSMEKINMFPDNSFFSCFLYCFLLWHKYILIKYLYVMKEEYEKEYFDYTKMTTPLFLIIWFFFIIWFFSFWSDSFRKVKSLIESD